MLCLDVCVLKACKVGQEEGTWLGDVIGFHPASLVCRMYSFYF
jgi:hypothetical protein